MFTGMLAEELWYCTVTSTGKLKACNNVVCAKSNCAEQLQYRSLQ